MLVDLEIWLAADIVAVSHPMIRWFETAVMGDVCRAALDVPPSLAKLEDRL